MNENIMVYIDECIPGFLKNTTNHTHFMIDKWNLFFIFI